MSEHRIATAAQALTFMLAGNATFTLRSERTGDRYTYKVQKADKRQPNDPDTWFVKVLSGPDNTSDFVYVGMIKVQDCHADNYLRARFFTTAKSRLKMDSPSVKAFTWALTKFQLNVIPDQLQIWHVNRCGRCGRVLTVPESVATGIGPDCAAQMGIPQVELGVTGPTGSNRSNREDQHDEWMNEYAHEPKVEATLVPVAAYDVEEKVREYRENNPEMYYQDGMLDEEEAYKVAVNKFQKELENR